MCPIFVVKRIEWLPYGYIQGVSERIVNVLGSGSMDQSE